MGSKLYPRPIRFNIRHFAENHLTANDITSYEQFCKDFNYTFPKYDSNTVRMNVKIMITNERNYRPTRKHLAMGWDDLFFAIGEGLEILRLYDSSKDPAPLTSNVGVRKLTWSID
jgi:hypothetical protein